MTDHPLSLPPGTVLSARHPDHREVRYVHIAADDDPLDAGGLLQGDESLVAAVWATLGGSDDHIDGDEQVVWLHALTEEHPTGIAHVTPSMAWFMPERDSLPDMTIALAAVLPEGSTLNDPLRDYLRLIDEYRTDGVDTTDMRADIHTAINAAVTEVDGTMWVLTAALADGRSASWSPDGGWSGDTNLIAAAMAVAALYPEQPERVRVARGLMGSCVDGWVPERVWVCARL
ncbi:hypothetical protein I3U40_18140 [Mycobacteroides abscessus subsp. abscessus]|uniref:hypothetical protein n=1 Tax=Mycobacteroides abscessus TaxID=36809 RepID=UPI0009D28D90|nr:hypothetical protein [Mycobacteroides abscessus]QSM92977.1 hypothetical protein I3U31_18130 [Mycobacteroides abscessus subsp. abscessus]QSM98015.1 hypothetical protein I3U40_18140 [Mycobacteroides abscessus subsp. abscessus]SLI41084.1 Uncharacterised protein [Mycobacteroides abscessus subsp. abscessus]